MRLFLILIFGLMQGSLLAQTKNYQAFYNEAKTAYQAKDFNSFYQSIAEAHKLHPYHQVILYNYGVACALTNRPAEAVGYLKRAVLINTAFDLTNPDLSSLQSREDFQELVRLKVRLSTPLVHSATAFTIKDRQLHTEGIAYDPKAKCFYVGSIHKRKVVKINADGNASDFTLPAGDGMMAVFGMKVDAKKNWLWVCSSPMPEMENYDSTLSSCVFKFELGSGKLLSTYKTDAGNSIFGDLTLDPQGNVYVSDSRNNIIFTVNEKTGRLDQFYSSTDFWNLQGITFTDDGQQLFIADYIKGVFRLDIKSKALSPVTCTLDVSLKGIDGLTYYRNSLIAIQNGVNPLRVMRYALGKDSKTIEKSEEIDYMHPAFNEPTIGTLVGNSFYYIANSQWGGYENGKIKPADQLQEIVILKATLD